MSSVQVLIKNKEKTKIEGFIIDEETGIKYDKIVIGSTRK